MSQVIFDHLTWKQYLKLPKTEPPLEYIDGQVVRERNDPVIYDGLTLMQFLRLPEAKPALEYIDGKVVQKVSPKTTHSVLQTMLAARILEHCRPTRIGALRQHIAELFPSTHRTVSGAAIRQRIA